MISITEKEFKQLSEYIEYNYGIHLKPEKRTLLMGRLQNVLLSLDIDNFTDYYNHVISDHTESSESILIERITTNHTFFMREAEHFDYYKSKALPYLVENVKNKDLRIWSAGCSSGEEPYTLAMINRDFFGNEKLFWDTKILATDISQKVMDIAQKGIYSEQELASLPVHWRTNYFKKYDTLYFMLKDQIKEDVLFRKFNLMENFPFKKKFHVIFCRNVMIYFDSNTKNELIKKFYNSLEYGGYLFIGHSESISRDKTGFRYVMPALYRKE
ncbi:MAG TPA: protein-glutamate O-methyltransferase CheR [Ruminiclostridium sp.]|nr:protein-glutamate O-methyltransferase CheR [Ruminiclostridium sp.]